MPKCLKEKVQRIISERHLCSYMNNTKWNELVTAIKQEMPFPPPFDIKYLTEENTFCHYLDDGDVDYCGDWSSAFPPQEYYFQIEWIHVRPRYLKYRGRLVEPEVIDGSEIFESILKRYHIFYEEKDGLYYIYGYR